MNSTKAMKIHNYLSSKEKTGVPVLTIARETQIKASELKKYLNQFPQSFIRVGSSSKYAINSFSSIKDHERYISKEIERHSNSNRYKEIFWAGISLTIFSSLLAATINFNGL